MKMGHKCTTLGVVFLSLLGPACAVEPLDEGGIRSSEHALGSTKMPVDIWDWNGLVGMVSDGNYVLRTSINAAGKTWTPRDFRGTFDGGDNTISNLTINSSTAGFFASLNQAIVRRIRLTGMNVSGPFYVGGLAADSMDSQIEQVSIEGTFSAPNGIGVGGIVGVMHGGSITRSYAKGIAQQALYYAGGLASFVTDGNLGRATISQSYAQMVVNPYTDNALQKVYAGGIAGFAWNADIHDVYAVGNVTGRGAAGGLVGELPCDTAGYVRWLLYKGIYRGDVVDRNVTGGGWSGVVGKAGVACSGRTAHLFYDRDLDPSSNRAPSFEQYSGTTAQLRSPTAVYDGIYCIRPDNCPTDGNFEPTIWTAGTSTQHHALRNMPGPNSQPR
jgi:hypothetical protein